MDKQHFVLYKRYRAVMKDGSTIDINLYPESCHYFYQQEQLYLIKAIRRQENIDIDQVEKIESYFVPYETENPVSVCIGV